MTELLAWHLGPGNAEAGIVRSTYRRELVIHLGDTVTATRLPILPCKRGPHASPTAVATLPFAGGLVIGRARLSGEIIAHGNPVDKNVATHRTHLAMADGHRLIPLWMAERVVRPMLLASGRSLDRRETTALDLVARWAADPETVSRDALGQATQAAKAATAVRDAWAARAAEAAWVAEDTRAWAAEAAWVAWAAWVAIRKDEIAAAELEAAFRWMVRETDERPAWIPATITPGQRWEDAA